MQQSKMKTRLRRTVWMGVLGGAAVCMVGGCAGQGRYQVGQGFKAPDVRNAALVPVIDTQTGRLWVWQVVSHAPEERELYYLGRPGDEAEVDE